MVVKLWFIRLKRIKPLLVFAWNLFLLIFELNMTL